MIVRQSLADPDRFYFDFDAAAPGGRGGASVLLSPSQQLASVDGVHKNSRLPPRSTGKLLAEGLRQTTMPCPALLEAYNVEPSTATILAAGGTGHGTLVGTMLEDAAHNLGGAVALWMPIPDGALWSLRIQIVYP